MRTLTTLALALLAAPLLLGMGSIGGTPEGTIPKTNENVRAHLVDRSGVTTDLTRFSMDGNVFINGRRGEGQMNIFFRDLNEVSFGPAGSKDVPADLSLKTGKQVQLKVDKSAIFYGDTGSGTYHISAGNVSRIVFPR